ncbi:hypothetical protein MIMGU_mgv1a018294mg [Erythranthe guttata]|uniref:Receptor-like serine/threonine-protein kinase n=1 Tax=Erythranthe guttata TaxID=4155 RepID=A0A022Q5L5_ERYGU|nr:hypothetical protein MIMGU_mgv1a018294mg [Erythranthe guttata]
MQSHRVSTASVVVFLISLHFSANQVSSTDTLKPGGGGGEFNSSSQLVSAKKIFTLGFYTPEDTNNTYLAIWYTDASRYPLWIANRENPVSKNSNPILRIGTTGENLVIAHGGGSGLSSYTLANQGRIGNISATLLDTGNFVVSSVSGEVLWQSFDYPTDTLLPGMKLGFDRKTGRNWTLSSWFGRNNPATGAYTLEWDLISGRLLVRRRGVVYWTSGEMKDYRYDGQGFGEFTVKEFENMDPPDPFNHNYNFTNVSYDSEEYFTYSLIKNQRATSDRRKVISRWMLNYQGGIYDIDRPTIADAGLCYGYNTGGSGFDAGCELRAQPTCRNDRETFVFKSGDFKPVDGKFVPVVYDGNSSLTQSDCREICWNDCECAAFIDAPVSGGCSYLRGENLEFVQSLDGSATPNTAVLLALGVALFVLRKLKQGILLTLDGYTGTNYGFENGGGKNNDLRLFTYASVLSATNNFSSDNKLGQGGFGPVYKGKTSEGHEIAVKLLSRQSGQGLLEFKTELVLISKLQHVNLVKLRGFCIHGDDKMIIYDYMPNKSLDFFLFNPSKREELNWQQRFNIIEGTAQGLLYLHKYSRLKIIHRDLKASNILLDENMTPKISDFGLARIFKQNIDEANTERRVGTYGYMAPEYAMQGIFSVKSDVYSFGVLVLEIVSGRKNSSFHEIEGPLNLVEYAWDLWRKDSAIEVMDRTLRDSCIIDQLHKCIHVGLLCVENHAIDRPNIEDVISILKNELTNLPLPKNPAFITRNSVIEEKIGLFSGFDSEISCR